MPRKQTRRLRAIVRRQIDDGRKSILVMPQPQAVGKVLKLNGATAIVARSTPYASVRELFDNEDWKKITPDHVAEGAGEAYVTLALDAFGLPVHAVEIV